MIHEYSMKKYRFDFGRVTAIDFMPEVDDVLIFEESRYVVTKVERAKEQRILSVRERPHAVYVVTVALEGKPSTTTCFHFDVEIPEGDLNAQELAKWAGLSNQTVYNYAKRLGRLPTYAELMNGRKIGRPTKYESFEKIGAEVAAKRAAEIGKDGSVEEGAFFVEAVCEAIGYLSSQPVLDEVGQELLKNLQRAYEAYLLARAEK